MSEEVEIRAQAISEQAETKRDTLISRAKEEGLSENLSISIIGKLSRLDNFLGLDNGVIMSVARLLERSKTPTNAQLLSEATRVMGASSRRSKIDNQAQVEQLARTYWRYLQLYKQ